MIHKSFIMLLLLGSQVLAAGQIPAPQIVPAQKAAAPVARGVQGGIHTFVGSHHFLLSQDREKVPQPFKSPLSGT